MKAALWTRYGPPEVLQLREVEKPVPKDNEVLIKIHATTVMAGDCEMRAMNTHIEFWLIARMMFGLFKPRGNSILGQEMSGIIESVGKDVTRFKKGDEIYGSTGMKLGGNGQYKCLPEDDAIVKKPSSISFEEAAPIPIGGQNSLFFLRQGDIKEGDKVLIFGASGGFGTFAVQIAKYLGADVTAVCSPSSKEIIRSLGASKVIDFTKEDFTNGDETYDVIFDPLGFSPYSRSMKRLRKGGKYLLANPNFIHRMRGYWSSLMSGKKVITSMANENVEDLEYLNGLVESGDLKTVIDRTYPLEKIVDAHRYVEKREKIGNVVIIIDHDN